MRSQKYGNMVNLVKSQFVLALGAFRIISIRILSLLCDVIFLSFM